MTKKMVLFLMLIVLALASVSFGQELATTKAPASANELRPISVTVQIDINNVKGKKENFSERMKILLIDDSVRSDAGKDLADALKDGDHILIERAVSDIYQNSYSISMNLAGMTRNAKDAGYSNEALFKGNFITKDQYLETRNFFRSGLIKVGIAPSEEVLASLASARKIVPSQFSIMENVFSTHLDEPWFKALSSNPAPSTKPVIAPKATAKVSPPPTK
jgi:hypothetical protein